MDHSAKPGELRRAHEDEIRALLHHGINHDLCGDD